MYTLHIRLYIEFHKLSRAGITADALTIYRHRINQLNLACEIRHAEECAHRLAISEMYYMLPSLRMIVPICSLVILDGSSRRSFSLRTYDDCLHIEFSNLRVYSIHNLQFRLNKLFMYVHVKRHVTHVNEILLPCVCVFFFCFLFVLSCFLYFFFLLCLSITRHVSFAKRNYSNVKL